MDIVLATSLAIGAAAMIYVGATCDRSGSSAGGFPSTGPCFDEGLVGAGGGALLLPTALLAISAGYGFESTSECRDAVDGLTGVDAGPPGDASP